MAGNSININSDVNTVNIQPDNNKITVVNPDNTSVNITQPVTNVIQVATPGPAGPAGPTGPTGPTGPSGSFETGSFVTTSSFNSFTSSIQTEVDNLTSQTGSYVLNSQTGSFATTGSNNFIGNQVITGSVDVKNGNINIESNSYFLQGTSTGGNNVSLIGVNNQDEIYIGNQGYGNIIAGATNIEGNTQITGSLTASGNISSSGIVYGTTGSFSHLQGNSPITVGDSVTFQQPITASGNISSSGNIITTEVTASKITSGDSTLILGYAGSNNITIEDGADFFINAPDGVIEIESGDGYRISISDLIEFDTPGGTALTLNGTSAQFGQPIVTTNITASALTSGDGSLILGYDFSNNITIEDGGDLFINAPDGNIEFYSVGTTVLTINNTKAQFQVPITASGNISASGTITGTTGSFNHIIGTISNIIWTVDFTDGELNTILYAPYNLSIDSIDNVYNSPTSSISSSGSPYTLGNAITTGEPIDITVSTGSVINLNITR
jgi:hypothetical protein